MNLVSLADEQLIRVLSFLRAADIAAVRSSCARFNEYVVSEAVRELMSVRYSPQESRQTHQPAVECDVHDLSLRSLHFIEIRFLLSLVSTPEPQQGYFISKTWLANAKKHWESQLTDRSKLSKKQARIQGRRGSDVAAPWPAINAEITCEHGNLADAKHVRRKRRIIDKRSWNALRQFFPDGEAFKSTCHDCELCLAAGEQQRVREVQRDIHVKEERRRELTACPDLMAIYTRRHGIPLQCQQALAGDPPFGPCPLISGLYYLVPRAWLTAWRKYMKDSHTPDPGIVDCTGLLCPGHGLLCPPPHVEQYLAGGRQNLLNFLGSEDKVPCEIVSADEWDALAALGRASDFSIRFVLDPDGGVQWSLNTCTRCDLEHEPDIAVRQRQRSWKK